MPNKRPSTDGKDITKSRLTLLDAAAVISTGEAVVSEGLLGLMYEIDRGGYSLWDGLGCFPPLRDALRCRYAELPGEAIIVTALHRPTGSRRVMHPVECQALDLADPRYNGLILEAVNPNFARPDVEWADVTLRTDDINRVRAAVLAAENRNARWQGEDKVEREKNETANFEKFGAFIKTFLFLTAAPSIIGNALKSRPTDTAPRPIVAPSAVKRRHNGADYRVSDEPLVSKMREMIMAKKARSPEDAARDVVKCAQGGGQDNSKVKRLALHYRKSYPDQS